MSSQPLQAFAIDANDFVLFTVMAYRYGWKNGGTRHVAVEVDLDRAILRAQEDHGGPGSKYGVAVYGWTSSLSGVDRSGELSQQESKLLHYLPSSYEEKEPYENERINMFTNIGQFVHGVVTEGIMVVSEDDGTAEMGEPVFNGKGQQYAVHIPKQAWLRHVVRKKEWESRFTRALFERVKQPRPTPGTRHEMSPEDQTWFDQTQARITQELESLFSNADKMAGVDEAGRQD